MLFVFSGHQSEKVSFIQHLVLLKSSKKKREGKERQKERKAGRKEGKEEGKNLTLYMNRKDL